MSKTARRVVVVTLLGVAVVAGLSLYADVGELGDRLAGFGWWAFVAALALALCNYALRFVRWALYLRNRRIKVNPVDSALVFVSGFALSITPGKLGELIKSYLLRTMHKVPIAHSAPVVVAERVTDLMALIILGVIGVALYGVGLYMVGAGAAVIAIGLLFLAWPRLSYGAIDLVTRPDVLRRFRDKLHRFYDGLAELTRPWPLTWATALAVMAWLCECIGFALIVDSFVGAHVPFGLAILIYAATTVAGALSFLPGGLLVTEGAMTLLLVQSAAGVDQATAVAATILTRIATLWFAVALGALALGVLRYRGAPDLETLEPAEPERDASPPPILPA